MSNWEPAKDGGGGKTKTQRADEEVNGERAEDSPLWECNRQAEQANERDGEPSEVQGEYGGSSQSVQRWADFGERESNEIFSWNENCFSRGKLRLVYIHLF